MKVKAIRAVAYNGKLYEAGKTFDLPKELAEGLYKNDVSVVKAKRKAVKKVSDKQVKGSKNKSK